MIKKLSRKNNSRRRIIMDIKKVTLTLILLTTFICGCKKKTDPAISKSLSPADFLSSATFKKLVVQVVYDQGYPPTTETINGIKSFLSARINKPEGIEVTLQEISGPKKPTLSVADMQEVETKYRKLYAAGNTLSIFFYATNAQYQEAESKFQTLGVQYGDASIVLFGNTIRNNSGGIGQPPHTVLETSVALHEFGHVLGLVNTGTSMVTPHMDEPHGHHCKDEDCLMYYAVETTDIVANLLGGKVPPLDADCSNDLKANGGK